MKVNALLFVFSSSSILFYSATYLQKINNSIIAQN